MSSMLVINELPPQIDRRLLDLLVKAEPATIGHFLHTGFMDPAIRGFSQDVRVAGTAVPIRVPGVDGTMVHYALGQVRPGDVLVMDRCGDMKHAALGGAVAYAARAAGVAGIIVDGMVTDLGELRHYGVPVWSRGPSPVTTKRLYQAGEFCVTISCGGVAVRPGDAILADENGVLVLPPDQIEAAANRAIGLQTNEKTTLKRLDAREKLPDITGATAMIREKMAQR
jgi:4-hydroxy-4-methyl-2-oxoglutarate aldolase